MKIISDFHDYYDPGLKYVDQNDNIIYKRNSISYNIKEKNLPSLVIEFYKKYNSLLYHANYRLGLAGISFSSRKNAGSWYDTITNKNGDFSFYRALIFFCGKIYPVYKVNHTKEGVSTNTYHYSFNDLEYFLKENKLDFYSAKDKATCIEFFNVKDSDAGFLIENKITIALIDKNTVIFNQRLANYDFFKVFDIYQAFQELNVWLCGTLSYPQNIMIELSDKSKIEKCGFDNKWSFRKRPL